MKFIARILLAATVVLIVAAATPSASANCGQARAFFTAGLGHLSYLYTPGHPFDGPYGPYGPDGGSYGYTVSYFIRGYFWALGAADPVYGPGVDHGNRNGYGLSAPLYPWLNPGAAGGLKSFIGGPFGHWQLPGTDGCITLEGSNENGPDAEECMVVLVSDRDFRGGSFHAVLAQPTTMGSPGFGDFLLFEAANDGPVDLAPLPVPEVLDSAFAGPGTIDARVSVAALKGIPDGLYLNCSESQNESVLQGYKIVASRVPPGDSPPRSRLQCSPNTPDCLHVIDSANWVDLPMADLSGQPIDVAPPGSEIRVRATCDGLEDLYLATSLVFDGGFRTPYVSANSSVIHCGTCKGPDADQDGFCATPDGLFQDCDDEDPATFPGAPQQCDGRNNDCSDPTWPDVPLDELDLDGDLFAVCAGDCAEGDPTTGPATPEVCNDVDDNCNDLVDEDLAGVDPDGDGWASACDNCPLVVNPDQADQDGDGRGDGCDGCVDRDHDGFGVPGLAACPAGAMTDCDDDEVRTFPGAEELYDGRDNDCDGEIDEGLDADGDGIPDFRDTCAGTPEGAGVDAFGCPVCDTGGSSGGSGGSGGGGDDEDGDDEHADDEHADDEDGSGGHDREPGSEARGSSGDRGILSGGPAVVTPGEAAAAPDPPQTTAPVEPRKRSPRNRRSRGL